MPHYLAPMGANQHRAKAQRNDAFLSELKEKIPDYCEWRVTAAFYFALHRIDQYLKTHDTSVQADHKLVDRHVKLNGWLSIHYPQLWAEYEPLWEDSLVARYGPESMCAKFSGELYLQMLEKVRLPRLISLL